MARRDDSLAVDHRFHPGRERCPYPILPAFDGVTEVRVRRAYEYPPHQHLNYEAILILEGAYACDLNETRLDLDPGDAVLVKPGDWHRDILPAATRYLALSFTLWPETPEARAAIFRPDVAPREQGFRVPEEAWRSDLERFDREAARPDALAGHVQDALLLGLFWRMVRALPREALAPRFAEICFADAFRNRLLRFFQQNLTHSLLVADMADALHMSESAFAHTCTGLLGVPPAKAFTRFRMERARELLRHTEMRVKEVSAYLGFENPYHFSRVFRKTFGAPPSAERG